jgi:hypothetical protein
VSMKKTNRALFRVFDITTLIWKYYTGLGISLRLAKPPLARAQVGYFIAAFCPGSLRH